jgi:hypothetical protein
MLGINLEPLKDWSTSHVFADAMRTARRFGQATAPWAEDVPLDADGWPVGNAGSCIATNQHNLAGLYKFSARGKVDNLFGVACNLKVTNLIYVADSNMSFADVLCDDEQLYLGWYAEGVIRDIKLIRPGYTATDVFTRPFLEMIAPFSTLRLMDYLETNNSPITSWDNRTKLTSASWSVQGGPIEPMIDLANATGKDLWICVPHLANDDYVEQLVELLNRTLKTKAYVEYSNEVWNWQFKQAHDNQSAAEAEVAAGDISLTLDGADDNKWYWGWRRVAKKIARIATIIGGTDGLHTTHPRIRPVLCSQIAWNAQLKEQLPYLRRYWGEPKDWLAAVAGAPYFDAKGVDMTRTDLTPEEISEGLMRGAADIKGEGVTVYRQLAADYGLPLWCYEMGVDLGQHGESIDAKIKANYLPSTGTAAGTYLSNWYDSGGKLACWFNVCCRYGQPGYWGLTEEPTNIRNSPKFLVAEAIAAALPKENPPADPAVDTVLTMEFILPRPIKGGDTIKVRFGGNADDIHVTGKTWRTDLHFKPGGIFETGTSPKGDTFVITATREDGSRPAGETWVLPAADVQPPPDPKPDTVKKVVALKIAPVYEDGTEGTAIKQPVNW